MGTKAIQERKPRHKRSRHKRRLTSLAVAWIDFRKSYDMVSRSWIQKCMEMFGVAFNVRYFVNTSMKEWNR